MTTADEVCSEDGTLCVYRLKVSSSWIAYTTDREDIQSEVYPADDARDAAEVLARFAADLLERSA